MSDEAKAVEEVAKTVGKLANLGEAIGRFCARFFVGPLEEVSGMVTDRLRFHRAVNLLHLQDRAEQILNERGITRPTRQLRLSFGIPLLEAGALEEEESLQDLWAALLANAADASVNIEPRTAFISILKSISPFDAKVVAQFEHRFAIPISELVEHFDKDKARLSASIHNLARLGCLSSPLTNEGVASALRSITRASREAVRHKVDPDRIGVNWMSHEFRSETEALESASRQLDRVYLTALGRDLLKACSRNPKDVGDSADE